VKWCIVALILSGGLLLRFAWLFTPAGLPDGDEAVFGLMAMHILNGRDYPIYCWGAHYAGALVSYLAALGFGLFGIGGLVLKGSTLLFAAGYLTVTFALAQTVLNARTARIALLFAAIPPAIPLAFSVKATGGYPETLFLGGLVLLLTFRLPRSVSPMGIPRGHLLLLGFSAGFGLYILPLILPYLAVACTFLLLHRRHVLKRMGWAWLFAGTLGGASPMLIYNVKFPCVTLLRLGSRVLDLSRAEALAPGTDVGTAAGWLVHYASGLPARLAEILRNLAPLVGLPVVGGTVLASIIGTAATLSLWHNGSGEVRSVTGEALGRYCAWLVPAVLLFAWVTGLNRPRHLLPLFSVLPLGFAPLYSRIRGSRPWAAFALLGLLLVIAGWDLVEAGPIQGGVRVAPLIQAAEQLGIRGLYADYDTAYTVMFASREGILASPTAWTHTIISDRTPEVTRKVDLLPNPAYVFPPGSTEAAWFVQGLTRRNISFNRQAVESFAVFTDLSLPVRSRMLPINSEW
jgi:hypothetical protein